MVYQLTRGIAYMNMLDVIHRDIKPQNVLMFVNNCKNGNNSLPSFQSFQSFQSFRPFKFVLKVADLGLARSQVCDLGITLTNPVYTLWYRSPEILLGSFNYTDKSDSWATAATIYEMAAKKPLFPAHDEIDELVRIAKVLGPPTQSDWDQIRNNNAIENRVKQLIKNYDLKEPRPDDILYPTNDKMNLLSDLIHQGLEYKPEKRWNTAEMLHHPYLDTVRDRIENDANLSCIKSPVILQDLYCKQKKCLIKKRYKLPNIDSPYVKLINSDKINNVVKFMANISNEYNTLNKTGYLALYIYFTYLSLVSNDKDKFQERNPLLIAAASYLIASKLTDRYTVSIFKLSVENGRQIPDRTPANIFRMEAKILKTLAWDLYVSTSYDFMIDYIKLIISERLSDVSIPFTKAIMYISNLKNLSAKYLMASVPLGFEYEPDLIALASIKKAVLETAALESSDSGKISEIGDIDEMFFDQSLNEKLEPLLKIIDANYKLLF
jgi:serine/threonine protein kinase